jgi:hypothetical protein
METIKGGAHVMRVGFPLSESEAIQLNDKIAEFFRANL